MIDLIEMLDYDTEFFGFKVGRYTKEIITMEEAREVLRECKRENISCLYAILDVNDFESINVASKSGFLISDIRIILEKNLTNFRTKLEEMGNYKFLRNDETIEAFKISDEIRMLEDFHHLFELGREISTMSRFSFDSNFPHMSAERLYINWIYNSIKRKYADKVFVAREINTQKPIGIVTCNNRLYGGEIALIGVAKNFIGKGIGSLLIKHACNYFKENRYKKVIVKTQAKNIPALQLYQKNGFYIYKTVIIFHLWTNFNI